MRRPARILLLAACAVAALVAAGCNKEEQVRLASTEGIYVTVDDLKYQIQISRILNPSAPDDKAYLRGLPASETLGTGEVWYGIFMRVENDTDKPHEMASQMTISDTQGNTFEPIQLWATSATRRPSSGPARSTRRSTRPRPTTPSAAAWSSSRSTRNRSTTARSCSPSRARAAARTPRSTSTCSYSAASMTERATGAAVEPPAPAPTSMTATATFGLRIGA